MILKNSFLHSYFWISPHIVYEIEKKNSILFYGTCIENIFKKYAEKNYPLRHIRLYTDSLLAL